MQSKIHSKNLDLTDDHKAYIEERIERLGQYAERFADESTVADVEVHRNSHKGTDNTISMEVTIHAPDTVIRAATDGITIETAMDDIFEKLKSHIDRYKSESRQSDAMEPESL